MKTGNNVRIIYPEAALVGVSLTDSTRQYLLRVGLPALSILPLGENFVPFATEDGDESAGPASGGHSFLEHWRGTKYRLLGYINYESYFNQRDFFAILEEGDAIWLLNDSEDVPPLFVNSCISGFVAALEVYKQFRSKYPESTTVRQVSQLRRQIRSLDPPSFMSGSFYWPVVIGDIYNISE